MMKKNLHILKVSLFILSLIYNIDLPRTKKEARIFQRMGIIPTHVIQLKVSNEYGKIIKKHI